MPYESTIGSVQVEAYTLSVKLTSDKRMVKAGEMFTLEAQMFVDDTPVTGTRRFEFWRLDPNVGTWERVATITSDRDGVARYSYTPSYDEACRDFSYKAIDETYRIESDVTKVAVAYPTRISISAPQIFPVGKPTTVSGKLEYESSPGVWNPLANQTVYISYNGTDVGTTTTDENGNYSMDVTIPSPGTYTIKAQYPGSGLPTAGIAGIFAPAMAIHISPFVWVCLVGAFTPLLFMGGVLLFAR
ncbi:MAG: hypothetical protein ACTSR0_04240 [Candidatus Asgardarchaeia archaeon]